MKETITILDKKKRIMLFRAPAQDTFKRRQLGKGLTLLGDGEILRLPFELHDAEADHRFADGCAPNQAELLSTPSWLRIVEDRPGPHVLATRDIKIKDILIGQRLRPVRPENVVKLAESLKQGQYRAITIGTRSCGKPSRTSTGPSSLHSSKPSISRSAFVASQTETQVKQQSPAKVKAAGPKASSRKRPATCPYLARRKLRAKRQLSGGCASPRSRPRSKRE
jgi:hypothetical protein